MVVMNSRSNAFSCCPRSLSFTTGLFQELIRERERKKEKREREKKERKRKQERLLLSIHISDAVRIDAIVGTGQS